MKLQWAVMAVLAVKAAAGMLPRQASSASATSSATTTSSSTSTSSSDVSKTTTGTWTNVNSDGSLSTHTVSVSTKDGTATTVNAPSGTGILGGEHLVCANTDGMYKPFCTPNNNATWYVGDRYAVSWDPKYYGNDTLIVAVVYSQVQQNAGKHAWESGKILANDSIAFITVDPAWLQGYDSNNITVQLIYKQHEPDVGPTITLTKTPPPPIMPAKERPLGVILGVPIAFVSLLVLSLAVCVCFRKHRQIGLGNVMGRRRGYATRKSKRERMKDKGGIRMDAVPVENRASNEWEVENVRGEGYHDEPRNAFRDEVARQNASNER